MLCKFKLGESATLLMFNTQHKSIIDIVSCHILAQFCIESKLVVVCLRPHHLLFANSLQLNVIGKGFNADAVIF